MDLRMTPRRSEGRSDEAPLRWGGGMKYASQALPRRRLLWPVFALGGLLLLSVLSVGPVSADKPDTAQALKPDSGKAVPPDTAAPQPQKFNRFQPGTGRLTGRVIDAETEKGIPGALVIIQGSKLLDRTNMDGRYQIFNITPGKYTVKATGHCYSTDTKKKVKIYQDLTTTTDFKIKIVLRVYP